MTESLGLLCWIRPRRAQIRPAPKVNATHLFDRKGPDLAYIAFHEPFESVEDADPLTTAKHTADRDRADHAVDPGRRPAPDQNTDDRPRRIHDVRTPATLSVCGKLGFCAARCCECSQGD